MRTKRSIKWGLLAAVAACVAVAAMPGCELLVDFDRSKIPQEGGLDGTTQDSSSDLDGTSPESSSGGDSSTGDSGDGMANDAPSEGSATDAPSEASEAATGDTGTDAPETSTDGGDDSSD
jgi:hypothetical protein